MPRSNASRAAERADRRAAGLLGGLLLALGSAATAQTRPAASDFTLYGGWRDGGTFVDVISNRTLRLEGSGAWSASYDTQLDANRQLQFFVSYQRTRLGLDASAATGGTPVPLPMRVVYLQIGGTNFLDGPIGRGPYLVGGLGATWFQPASSRYAGELRPSLNLGIGYETPLADRIALRAEARGYATVVDSSGGLFCSGGCVFKIRGDVVFQGEALLGLSYRF
jgi:hypothetical protein